MSKNNLPRYKCTKEVRGVKIAAIIPNDDGASIVPADVRFKAFDVDAEYMQRHVPEEGGYFVLYKDGYESFSPAEAFEDGYRLILTL